MSDFITNETRKYSQLSRNGHLKLFPPFLYSLYLTLYKTDISLRRKIIVPFPNCQVLWSWQGPTPSRPTPIQSIQHNTRREKKIKTAAEVIEVLHNSLLEMIAAEFSKVRSILAVIPATSSKRSFSSLRPLKTYLRGTMGQNRLNSPAITCIERFFIANSMDRIIKFFGECHGRNNFFDKCLILLHRVDCR